MEQHYGQIVEKVIRRNGYSISELARLTNVNRRSVYNWFHQKRLKPEIIYRIGVALNYDFSKDFPKLLLDLHINEIKSNNVSAPFNNSPIDRTEENYWKDKYIKLLEKYNDSLTAKTDPGI
jgi:transcriptional regulator with XRE-family HTH domain